MNTLNKKSLENDRETIIQIIFDHKLKESEIAKVINVKEQTLWAQLHSAKNFPEETRDRIHVYFRTLGIMINQPDECQILTNHFFDLTSIISLQLSILSDSIKKTVVDDNVTLNERNRLVSQAMNLKDETVTSIDELINLLKGESSDGKRN